MNCSYNTSAGDELYSCLLVAFLLLYAIFLHSYVEQLYHQFDFEGHVHLWSDLYGVLKTRELTTLA